MNIKRIFQKIDELLLFPKYYKANIQNMYLALGRIEAKLQEKDQIKDLKDAEFKVFSHAGEDGIIQYLIKKVPIERKIFIEFGVQDYKEANTRFLLSHNNWSGLVIDGLPENIEILKSDSIYWNFNLKAEASFITAENINAIFKRNGVTGDIGILSIDIDGVDYWVWKAIDSVSPRIIIAEYNSLFGPHANITVPYKNNFYRTDEHYSNLYFGASISALTNLGKGKGYSLVGSDSSGANAFFLRNDLIDGFKILNPAEAYVKCQFRQSRNIDGHLDFLDFEESVDLISYLPVVDLTTNRTSTIKEILN